MQHCSYCTSEIPGQHTPTCTRRATIHAAYDDLLPICGASGTNEVRPITVGGSAPNDINCSRCLDRLRHYDVEPAVPAAKVLSLSHRNRADFMSGILRGNLQQVIAPEVEAEHVQFIMEDGSIYRIEIGLRGKLHFSREK